MNRRRVLLVAAVAVASLTVIGGALASTAISQSGPVDTLNGEDGTASTEDPDTTSTGTNRSSPPTKATAETNKSTSHLVAEGKSLRLEAAPGQMLRGETSLKPGAEIRVELRTPNDTGSPFLRSLRTNTTENGSFRTQVDLAHVSAGTPFNVTVYHAGSEIITTDGVVIATSDTDGET